MEMRKSTNNGTAAAAAAAAAAEGSPAGRASHALLRSLGRREPELHEHVCGVADLAIAVGRRLGMDERGLDLLARAAELHDLGKLAVPDAVLHKPAGLDGEEWELMRRHTVIGERMLVAVPELAPVAPLVRASHERYDGAGYPDGLAGDEIPLGARIVAVCDAFEAMTADRSYRTPVSQEEALAELRRCGGTQFDPDVVEAFCEEATRAQRRIPAPLLRFRRVIGHPSRAPHVGPSRPSPWRPHKEGLA